MSIDIIYQGVCRAGVDARPVFAVLAYYRHIDWAGIYLIDLYPGIGRVVLFAVAERTHLLTDPAAAASRKHMIDINLHRVFHDEISSSVFTITNR
jgi:hypothetical protein